MSAGTNFQNVVMELGGGNGGSGTAGQGNDGGDGSRGGGAVGGGGGGKNASGNFIGGNGAGQGYWIFKLQIRTRWFGNSANQGGADSGGGSGGSGVVYIVHNKDLTVTVGAGLTSSTGSVGGDAKYLKITAGSET